MCRRGALDTTSETQAPFQAFLVFFRAQWRGLRVYTVEEFDLASTSVPRGGSNGLLFPAINAQVAPGIDSTREESQTNTRCANFRKSRRPNCLLMPNIGSKSALIHYKLVELLTGNPQD
jgi:hypothetical protein